MGLVRALSEIELPYFSIIVISKLTVLHKRRDKKVNLRR